MKILCVNSVISELGGTEFAAMNLACGLVTRAHEVHFLGAYNREAVLSPRGGASFEQMGDKIHRHHRRFPRTYPLGEQQHGMLRKLLWHVQDIAHPTNEKVFAKVLGEIEPDLILLHNTNAVGANIWRTIVKSRIPCIQVVHDFGLICLNKARFRSGHQCSGLCAPCRIQKFFRFSQIANCDNFAFVSPSYSALHEIERYVSLSPWRKKVIPNANRFVVKPRDLTERNMPRLLYAGRLEPSKGVDMVLRAARIAQHSARFALDVLGTGSSEQSLRRVYADSEWVTFHGNVDQETLAEFMSRAAVLLLPSLWLENAPVVAAHALFAGLPILGSHIGGIPELVEDGRTGRLLPPGDEEAWAHEIIRVVGDRQQLTAWSAACSVATKKFGFELALDQYEKLMEEMISERARGRSGTLAL